MMNMKTKEKGSMALVVLGFFIFCMGITMTFITVSASEISPPEPELLWKYDTGEWINYITVADLGGDGEKDVVISGKKYFHALNSSGSLLWKNRRSSLFMSYELAIGDIDGDGINDFVVGARDGFTSAIKSNGSILWTYKTNIPKRVYAADINGDRLDDVVACSIDGNIYAIRNNGSFLWKYNTSGTSHVSIGDVNGDGINDVVAASKRGYIYAIKNDGTLIWKYHTGVLTIDRYADPICLGDLDGDGINDVTVGSWDDYVYAINRLSHK